LSWKEMLAIFHKYMGMPNRKVLTIPSLFYRLFSRMLMKDFRARGIDSGLDLVRFIDIQTSKTYIDKSIVRDQLGVTDDDIDAAIGDSVKLCLEAIAGKAELIEMKAE